MWPSRKPMLLLYLCFTNACLYQSKVPPINVSEATLTASVSTLHLNQPTSLQVALLSHGEPVANVATQITSAGVSLCTGGGGKTDSQGLFGCRWTPPAQAGNVMIDASIVVGGRMLTLEPIQVQVVAGASFAMVPASTNAVPAGSAIAFTLYALSTGATFDANKPTADANYAGVVTFTSPNDVNAVLPGPITFAAADRGIKAVTGFVATRATTTTLVATDAEGLNGSQDFAVAPGAAVALSETLVTAIPASQVPIIVNVTPIDAYGNATSYTGIMSITVTKGTALGSWNVTCPSQGVCSASITLQQSGVFTFTATGASGSTTIQSSGIPVTVLPAPVTSFAFSGLVNATAGSAQTCVVKALDPCNNVSSSFTGVVSFTSSDPRAVLPAAYTYTTADAGSHAFGGPANSLSFVTAGLRNLSASTVNTTGNTVLSASSNVTITAAAASSLAFTQVPTPSYVCTNNVLQVAIKDVYGNVTNNSNVVTMASSGTVTPTSVAATNGVAAFTFTSRVQGSFTFTASSPSLASANASTQVPASSPNIILSASAQQANGCVALSYQVQGSCDANVVLQFVNSDTGLIENLTAAPNTPSGLYGVTTAYANNNTFLWDSTHDLPVLTGTIKVHASTAGSNVAGATVSLFNGANYTLSSTGLSSGLTNPVIATGRFDTDGLTDAMAVSGNQLLYSRNMGNVVSAATLPAALSVSDMVVGPFAGNGNSQAVICALDVLAKVHELTAYGTGSTGSFTQVMSPFNVDCNRINVIDIDRNGLPDLVTADSNGNLLTLINQSTGPNALKFSVAQTIPLGSGTAQPTSVSIGDLDRNGTQDVFLTSASSQVATMIFGTGTQLSPTLSTYQLRSAAPAVAQLADFDRDGILDVASVTIGATTASVVYGTNVAAFGNPFTGGAALSATIAGTPILPVDADGDGWIDIVSIGANGILSSLNITANRSAFVARVFGAPTAAPNTTFSGAASAITAATLVRRGETDLTVTTPQGLLAFRNARATRCNPVLSAPVYFSTLPNATSSGVGDLDSDGSYDIISVNANSPNYTIQYGDGSGNIAFQLTNSLPAGATYPPGVIADFDGDGINDIGYGTDISGTGYFEFFLGNGSGGFLSPAVLPLGTNNVMPGLATVANLQNSNQPVPDIAVLVPTQQSSSTGVLLALINVSQPGHLAFSAITTTATADQPMAIIATPTDKDLNGDSIADFIVINSNAQLYGLYGSHSGAVVKGPTYGTDAIDMVTGDFDGDGKGDVFALASNGNLTLYTSAAGTTPTFTKSTVIQNPNCSAVSLAASTVNGQYSLATLCHGGVQRVVVTALSAATPQRTFNIPVTMPNNGAGHVYMADFSNDGFPDVLAISYQDGNALLARYDGNLYAEYEGADTTLQPVVINPNGLALAEYGRNGYFDAFTTQASSNTLYTYAATSGAGDWDDNRSPQAFSSPFDVGAADVDRDGYPDICATRHDNLECIVNNTTNPTFTLSAGGHRMALADFNNDGWPDIVVVSKNTNTNYWLNARSTTAPYPATPTSALTDATLTAFAVGDVDGSGSASMVVGRSTGTVQTYRLGSSYAAVAVATSMTSQPIQALELADFANQGYAGSLVGVTQTNLFVASNSGSGAFTAPSTNAAYSLLGTPGDKIAVGDVSQDGVPDVIVPIAYTGAVQVFTGNPNGSLNSPVTYMLGYMLGVARTGDIDRDGVNDVTISSGVGNGIAVTRSVITAFGR